MLAPNPIQRALLSLDRFCTVLVIYDPVGARLQDDEAPLRRHRELYVHGVGTLDMRGEHRVVDAKQLVGQPVDIGFTKDERSIGE